MPANSLTIKRPGLVTDQRRGEAILSVEGGGLSGAVEQKRALIIIAAVSADRAKAKTRRCVASLAEGVAGAHIAARVVVAHLEAGEIFGARLVGLRERLGRAQAEAEQQDAPCSACAHSRIVDAMRRASVLALPEKVERGIWARLAHGRFSNQLVRNWIFYNLGLSRDAWGLEKPCFVPHNLRKK
jgi:hypothetical protein